MRKITLMDRKQDRLNGGIWYLVKIEENEKCRACFWEYSKNIHISLRKAYKAHKYDNNLVIL